MRKIHGLFILLIIFTFLSKDLIAQLPVSKEATLIESVSSAEVMIEATGIYKSKQKKKKKAKKDVTEKGVKKAIEDARKATVYFILFGGTDPLISTPQERQRLDKYTSFFFDINNVNTYITFEETEFRKKVKIDGGRGIRVTKRFKINKELLTKDLEARNILEARAELAEAIGNPFIMVMPAVQRGESPIDLLRTNPRIKHAAAVVESYLTARKYDVIVPEQQAALSDLSAAQQSLAGREEDYAYQLALSIGSDVYITFSGTLEDAGYGTKKYAMAVRAYETTTARLLGTETGYSQGRQGEVMVSIEEAMNDAVDNVLSRITNYWKDDVKRGVQYKLIVNISTDFDEDQIEDIQFAFMDVVEEIAKSSKENIVTDQTLDYIIWCDPAKYDKSSKVYRKIKKAFKDAETEGTLRRININRKMILLKVDYE
ncbi:MAG: hypothetical protein IIA61_07815 [Candidatus Marinimicrobia bacterium]|nr:hypothetical protein [Candidatus Neomarinimicrobiota bacterium]